MCYTSAMLGLFMRALKTNESIFILVSCSTFEKAGEQQLLNNIFGIRHESYSIVNLIFFLREYVKVKPALKRIYIF